MQEHEFVRRVFEATDVIVKARDACPEALLQAVPKDISEAVKIVRETAREMIPNCFLDETIERLKQDPKALQVVAWATTTLDFHEQRAAMERARARGAAEIPFMPAFALGCYLLELCTGLESRRLRDAQSSES